MNSSRNPNNVIYGNCRVHHPDGSLMFLCIEKRAKWYLNRNLAKVLQEDPLTIQLTFVPKGRGAADQDEDEMLYHLGEKSNSCVVCGSEDMLTLTRHHVVPYEYRKFFPEEIKGRSSHDIVPICRKDHDTYENVYATKLKRELEKNLGIEPADSVYSSMSGMAKAHGFAKMLMDPDKVLRLPDARVKYFMKEITRVFGKTPLAEIVEINMKKVSKEKLEEVAKRVVDSLGEDKEKMHDFAVMWRKHFVESMNPQFLPSGWKVDHKLKKSQH
jgi:hypothetical protein